MNINDFAHIPWEDTPNFPKAPQRKEFLHKLLVKHPGYLPGVCGWDLREYHAVDLPPTQDSRWIPVPRFVGQGILKKTFIVAVTGWGVIDIRYDILLFAFFGGVIYFLRDSIILIHHFSLPFGEYFFVKHLSANALCVFAGWRLNHQADIPCMSTTMNSREIPRLWISQWM